MLCNYYDAKDDAKAEGCCNCSKFVSVECLEYLERVKRDKRDRLMKELGWLQ